MRTAATSRKSTPRVTPYSRSEARGFLLGLVEVEGVVDVEGSDLAFLREVGGGVAARLRFLGAGEVERWAEVTTSGSQGFGDRIQGRKNSHPSSSLA